ncbi:hypothetical protein [Actinoplanes subglobosus]|uniref:Uncharacterized protein n=1 Tax=Actinoplanes subglobosus TaxID=1547892 RepID=A0ABV8IX72_9ACTN
MSDSDLAHSWTEEILGDDGLSAVDQVRLALGLLDLIDEFGVAMWLAFHLSPWYLGSTDDPAAADAFWAGMRRRLEAPEVGSQLLYSLWVEWFESRVTDAWAFAEVLGGDADRLPGAGPELLRRADRVLRHSGPVPWPVKRHTYATAAAVPALVPGVFRGILASYHDYYGDLDPGEALALLDRLDLPPDTEHLASLRAVLSVGARNHYRNPELWS